MLNPTEKLAEFRERISSSDVSRVSGLCSRLADEFEDELLNHKDFPDAYLEFFLTLLSEKDLFHRPGVWNFLLAVNNAKDALTEDQYERIADVFSKNYRHYSDSDLSLATCDFIARNFAPKRAVELLRFLKEEEQHKQISLRRYADEGLLIVQREAERAVHRQRG